MSQQRHEILGKNLHTSLEECMQCMAKEQAMYLEFTAPGKPHQQFARESQIRWAVRSAVLEHLGYGPLEGLSSRLNEGVDRALDYFFGDWWRLDETDARALDKSRPDRALRWFNVLPNALLLGGLSSRWDDVSKICSWFDASLEMEYRGGLNENADMQLMLCIASSLSPTPMEPASVAAMVANIKASRASARGCCAPRGKRPWPRTKRPSTRRSRIRCTTS